MNRRFLGEFALLTVAASWGFGFVAIKWVLGWMGPITFLWMRFALSFVILAALFPSRILGASRATVRAGAFIGFFLAIAYMPQTMAMQLTSVSMVAFLTGLYVVFVPFFQALLLRKKPGALPVFGAILSVIGLGVLSLTPGGLRFGLGEALATLCAMGFAMHIITVGKFAPSEDPVTISAIQIGAAAVITAAVGIPTEPLPGILPAGVVVCLVYLTVVNVVVATFAQNWAQQVTQPTQAALLLATEPVFGAIAGFVLLGERIGLRGVVGDALIFCGMIVSQVDSIRQARAAPCAVAGRSRKL
ncbi:MAG: DMT family transporter [Ignavibacteriales bacterium]